MSTTTMTAELYEQSQRLLASTGRLIEGAAVQQQLNTLAEAAEAAGDQQLAFLRRRGVRPGSPLDRALAELRAALASRQELEDRIAEAQRQVPRLYGEANALVGGQLLASSTLPSVENVLRAMAVERLAEMQTRLVQLLQETRPEVEGAADAASRRYRALLQEWMGFKYHLTRDEALRMPGTVDSQQEVHLGDPIIEAFIQPDREQMRRRVAQIEGAA